MLVFQNKNEVCRLSIQNGEAWTGYELTKDEAMGIIEHLQEWVGTKDNTCERQSIIPEVSPRIPNLFTVLLKPNYKAKDGTIKQAIEICTGTARSWLAPTDDLYEGQR